MRPAMRIALKRVTLAAAMFVVVHTMLAAHERDHVAIQQWIVRAAKNAGCQPIFESRGMMWGPDGPFYGDDLKTRVFNYLAMRGAWWVQLSAGFTAAMGTLAIASLFERTRVLGYRGDTRCGVCGYGLKGLKEPRCPECGHKL